MLGPGSWSARLRLLLPAIAVLAVLLLMFGNSDRPPSADRPMTDRDARHQTGVLLGGGQTGRARQIAARQLASVSQSPLPDKLAQAWWQNELGLIDLAQGKFPDAIAHFHQSLATREQLLGQHHADTALVLNNLGVLYNRLGRYAEAEPLLRRAIAATRRTSVPDSTRTVTALENLGLLYLSTGHFALAEELLQEALERSIRAEGSNSVGAATAKANLASLYITRQQFALAEKLLLQTLEIDQQKLGRKNPLTAITLNNLGELYRLQGRYDQAELMYRRAIDIDRVASGAASIDYAADISNLATLHRQIGSFASAHRLLQQALAIVERRLPIEHPLAAATFSDLAMLCLAEGRPVEAETLLLRALQIEEKISGRDHPSSLATLASLANLYAGTHRLRKSETLYRRTLAISTTAFGKNSPSAALAMNNLSSVLLQMQGLHEAGLMLKQSLAIAVREFGTRSVDVARIEETTAQLHRQLGQLALAESHIRKALGIWQSTLRGDTMEVIWASHLLSGILFDLGKMREAHGVATRAAAQLARRRHMTQMARLTGQSRDRRDSREIYRQVLRTAFSSRAKDKRMTLSRNDRTIDAAVQLAEDDTGAAMTVSALQFASPSKSQRHLVHLQQMLLAQHQTVELQLTSAISARDSQAQRQTAVLRKSYTQLSRQLQAIDATLHRNHPLYAAHLNSDVPTAEQVRKSLATDEAIVLIVTGANETFVLVLTHTSAYAARVELTEAEAASDVAALRQQLDPGAWTGSYAAFDRSRAHRLYTLLWQPFEDVLADRKNVFVVADGPLASLPMALLVSKSPEGGPEGDSDPVQLRQTHWLVKRHALTTLPSVLSFVALHSTRSVHQPRDSFAGFGSSRSRLGSETLPPLPFASAELHSLASTMHASPISDVYTDDRATETQVKSKILGQKRILAFATHAVQTQEPGVKEAALLLNPPVTPTPNDDGILRASEIAQLELQADLVILSACNTAQEGSPALSLTRAFFLAGTRSLLVSHWPVWDRLAGKITTLTVANIQKHPDEGRAEALRQAMLSVMNDRADPLNAHPSVWATFALVGESRID